MKFLTNCNFRHWQVSSTSLVCLINHHFLYGGKENIRFRSLVHLIYKNGMSLVKRKKAEKASLLFGVVTVIFILQPGPHQVQSVNT